MRLRKGKKLFLVLGFLFLVYCGAGRREGTEVNFSVAICNSLSVVQVSKIPLADGTTTYLINCQSLSAQSGNIALIFYSDGEVSLVPIDQRGIDLTKKVKLLSAKAFLHSGGQIDSTYESSGKDLIIFKKNVQEADVSLAYFVSKDSGFLKFILDGLSSIATYSELINKKSYVFIYTQLSAKNLSSIVSPIFDDVFQLVLGNLKVGDLILNFPDVVTQGDKILISIPNQSADIASEVPPLPIVLPEINFSTISDISASLPYYELDLTETSVKIPLVMGNVSNILNILSFQDGIIYYGRTPILFEGRIPKQISVGMEVIPPTTADVNSSIHIAFPDGETSLAVEIYSFYQGAPLLVSRSQVFKERPTLPIRIPQFLTSGAYYVAIRSEKSEKTGEFVVKDTFARYEISQVPYISYNADGLKSEQFIFDVALSQESLKLSWRIPNELDIQSIDPNLKVLIPECVSQKSDREFLNSKCITSYIDIFAEDSKGEEVIVWRIYGLFKSSSVVLPNFLSRTLLFDILKYAPQVKLKKVRLNYNAYFGSSLLTFKRSFIFD